jgi:7,8-dihydroneopterin aldolase/epimerase/oxygenase
MDRITLRGIRAYGRHGANPGERDAAQRFDVEIVTELDLRVAQVSDDLADTLDYDALHRRIVEIVEGRSYALLERLAGDLLDAIFDDARVIRAQVTIEKPGILDGATPGVTLARERY